MKEWRRPETDGKLTDNYDVSLYDLISELEGIVYESKDAADQIKGHLAVARRDFLRRRGVPLWSTRYSIVEVEGGYKLDAMDNIDSSG